jgi:hypothetical protein
MKRERKLNYFEMKRKISKLQELSARNAEPEEYLHLLELLVNKVFLKATTIKNEFIYRSRMNFTGILFNNLADLKYPPKDEVKIKGRLNDIGESILYAALGELGTLIEARPQFNKLFTISTIRHRNREGFFIPIGITGSDIIVTPRSKTEELLINYFNSGITKNVSNPIEYNSTIAIAHLFLRKPVLNCMQGRLSGIIYPSVESKKMSNKTTYNVAIYPDIFDSCFIIENVSAYCLTFEQTHYQLNEVNRVILINNDGTLKWLYDFNEMKERISKGFLAERGTCINLIGVEKYI